MQTSTTPERYPGSPKKNRPAEKCRKKKGTAHDLKNTKMIRVSHILHASALLLLGKAWCDLTYIIRYRQHARICMELVREGTRLMELAMRTRTEARVPTQAQEQREDSRKRERVRSHPRSKSRLRRRQRDRNSQTSDEEEGS